MNGDLYVESLKCYVHFSKYPAHILVPGKLSKNEAKMVTFSCGIEVEKYLGDSSADMKI